MNIDNLNTLLQTFHDFDLIEFKPADNGLIIKIECYWNEMIDVENPCMYFTFSFLDCEISGFEIDYDEVDSNYKTLSTSDYRALENSDIYINRFEVINDQHWIYCNGNQEKSNALGAIIKLKFNSFDFMIYDSQANELDFNKYMALNKKWWGFVSKD